MERKYYLCYQAVKSPYTVRVKNTIGMACADSPEGLWTKTDKPVLEPSDTGEWEAMRITDSRLYRKAISTVIRYTNPCIIPYNGKFYMYYKGERMGEESNMGWS